jgi:hypothetical protein
MSARLSYVGALAASVLAIAPLDAQSPEPAGWLDRVSLAARYGSFQPAGRSEVFSLIDRALAPGSRALRPRLVGGELHVRVSGPWGLVFGAETGSSTVASISRVQPTSGAGDVRQQTSLDLTAVETLGAEWRAFRWRGSSPEATDRLRVVLGAGAGVASYRLRQWGEFVDADRRVAYADDFGSTGRGTLGYASAGVEVPLRAWLALQGDVRRQVGSAPMSADFASFDRLDLGGTRVGAGLVVSLGGKR